MPGQAVITINETQWNVWVASTYAELTTGLRGRTSIDSGTGMVFILPATQAVSVDTTGMNFALDIIFIANSIVIDVARNIEPGYLVTEETPCDSFLEVNAGEAVDVEVGDTVSTTAIQEPGFDWSTITSFAIPLALLGFVCAMAGGMMTGVVGSSSPPKQLKSGHQSISGEPRRRLVEQYGSWAVGRAEAICPEGDIACVTREAERLIETLRGRYGEELPERGKGQGKVSVKCPICGKEIEVVGYDRVTRSETLKKHIEKEHRAGHHSMWLTLGQRKELETKYGAVAVRWAEEATKPGDIKGVETAAEYYYKKIREAFGLGHLSPELSEEQIMKLREVLGLTASAAEALKIHQETGYIA
ncbi:hypothetical protein ES707_00897 [subsurface metagenome]